MEWDLQDHQGHLDHPDHQDHPESQAMRRKGPLVLQAIWDPLDLWEVPDRLDYLVVLAILVAVEVAIIVHRHDFHPVIKFVLFVPMLTSHCML